MPGPADDLPKLCGLPILIAESNPLIALDLAETLRSWGAQPLLYSELTPAEQAEVPGRVGAALVDLARFHQQAAGLIEALRRRGVPTVGTTAWQLDIIGSQFPEMTVFEKPVNYAALAQWFKTLDAASWPGHRCCNG